ncbi:hypothetical protein KC19_2G121000 [Ceratodon purpureus]|uniref:ADP-ribosyl cyclase/cyclic ADP-ribose hydrolase n=1 Tax=Ceratodon purpureus TaxID=3225 RepID=A0A8T0IUM6_CERPU|nr:hypothetical protein KC19_2G121000 [Ceratodon purpureus]
MSKPYDIFLSHSGAQKDFVEQLFTELKRQYGHYSVFFDKDSIKHGEQISPNILEHAKTCKLAVAVLSEEYLTRRKPPMLELAASYTASKNGKGVPCLLPVFLDLKPEHAKSSEKQKIWKITWEEWKRNETMSDRPEPRTNRVEPTVWREALVKLLDTRGPVYKPDENEYKSAFFAKKVAGVIADKLDELSKTKVSYKATNCSDSASMEHLSKDSIRMTAYADSPHVDQMEDASTTGETQMEVQ